MIIKKNLFQIETDEEYYVIRITADSNEWRFTDGLTKAVGEAQEEMKARGLKPVPANRIQEIER